MPSITRGRKRKSVTLRHVAARARLSATAVSMALADHPQISRETRQRVHRICRELGYETMRRDAPGGRIGFFLLGIPVENPVNTTLLHHLTRSAEAANLRLEIRCAPEADEPADVVYQIVELARKLDGVLLMGLADADLLTALCKADVPVVVIGHAALEPGQFPRAGRLTVVAPDDTAQAQFATARLLTCGHRRIGFVSEILYPGLSHARWLAGYTAALGLARVPCDHELIQITGQPNGDMTRAADAFAAMPVRQRPTAYIIPDVRQAWAFLAAMRHHDIDIPRQCLVMNGNPDLVQQYQMQDYPMVLFDTQHFVRLAVWHLRALRGRQTPCPSEVLMPFSAVNFPEPA